LTSSDSYLKKRYEKKLTKTLIDKYGRSIFDSVYNCSLNDRLIEDISNNSKLSKNEKKEIISKIHIYQSIPGINTDLSLYIAALYDQHQTSNSQKEKNKILSQITSELKSISGADKLQITFLHQPGKTKLENRILSVCERIKNSLELPEIKESIQKSISAMKNEDYFDLEELKKDTQKFIQSIQSK
jgi:hypothetical protein